jgi:hypothetical protein
MSEFRPFTVAAQPTNASLCNIVRRRILPGLALCGLVHAGLASADERAFIARATFDPVVDYFHPSSARTAAALATPGVFSAPAPDSHQAFSSTDFRPRKRTVFDVDPAVNVVGDAPLLHTTTVWQRMSEYKSHDRVQVLTLWESSGSMVSLQAGKHGDPSLQWTSRLMNHGGSTQGLLDRLFSVSLAGATAGLRNATRSSGTAATSKPTATQALTAQK